jgi:hypothetical protein
MAPFVSPLLVALSLLCNLAVFALLANTHNELGAVRATAAASQPRRSLLEPPPAVDESFGAGSSGSRSRSARDRQTTGILFNV